MKTTGNGKLKRKVFWFDTETTGVDAKENSIIQLAALVEINGEVVAEKDWKMRPLVGRRVEAKALEVNRKTREEVEAYPSAEETFARIIAFLDSHIDRYDKGDKFFAAGYNVDFDIEFLRALFLAMGHKYFGSYFHWPSIDVKGTVAEAWERLPHPMKNCKLGTVCESVGIKLDAHDALNDIRATRELYMRLKGREEAVKSFPCEPPEFSK